MNREKKRILLVDDEEAILFALKDILSETGLIIDTASTSHEAQELLNQKFYSGAVVDLRLGGSDVQEGFAVIRMVKGNHSSCKIIVVTAYGLDDTKAKALDLGADIFLEKPVSPEEIRDQLRSMGVY